MREINPPDWYYEVDADDYETSQLERFIRNGSEFVEEIVKQLYSKGTLNKAMLEHSLDELCRLFNVNIGQDMLQVQRTNNVLFDMTKFLMKEREEFENLTGRKVNP